MLWTERAKEENGKSRERRQCKNGAYMIINARRPVIILLFTSKAGSPFSAALPFDSGSCVLSVILASVPYAFYFVFFFFSYYLLLGSRPKKDSSRLLINNNFAFTSKSRYFSQST